MGSQTRQNTPEDEKERVSISIYVPTKQELEVVARRLDISFDRLCREGLKWYAKELRSIDPKTLADLVI